MKRSSTKFVQIMPLGFSIIGSTVTFDLFLRWATQGPLGPLVFLKIDVHLHHACGCLSILWCKFPLSRRWWYCYTVLLVINTAVEVVAWPCVITGMLSEVPLLLMFALGIWNLKQDTNQVSWFETALINWCFSSLFAHTIFFTRISLVYLSGLHLLASSASN